MMPAAECRSRVDRTHGVLFAAAALAAVALELWLPDAFATVQWPLLIAGVALGIPHGAFDVGLARRHFGLEGTAAHASFGAAYLGLAVATVALWWWSPTAGLGLFLVLAAVHFGVGDARLRRAPRELRIAERLTRGALPLVLPVALHPAAVTGPFEILADPAAAADLVAVGELLLAPVSVLCVAVALACLWRGHGSGRASVTSRLVALELGALAALFGALPPLAAFALYFGLMHSPRHLLDVGRRYAIPTGALLRETLAPTLATFTAALALFLLLSGNADERTLRIVFVGLAALTVPHMLLVHDARDDAPATDGRGLRSASDDTHRSPA